MSRVQLIPERCLVFIFILVIFHDSQTSQAFLQSQLQNDLVSDICPSWIEAHINDDSHCESRKILQVSPAQGFGNKLNGVLQGIVGAYLLDRCLILDWKYNNMLNISAPLLQKRYKTFEGLAKFGVGSKKFPAKEKELVDLLHAKSLNDQLLIMHVGYRDRLCRLLLSPKFNKVSLGISYHSLSKKRKNRTLCVFLERCIMHQVVRPNVMLKNALNSFNKMWRKNKILMAIQIRMGDYASYHDLKQSSHNIDERVPPRALNIFWKAAKAYERKYISDGGADSIDYFIATDNNFALEAAKVAFGSENILHTRGNFQHSDSKSVDISSSLKMFLDWFLISEADIVIQGPWSTFVEKAIVFSAKKQHIIRCSNVKDVVNELNWIVKDDDWICSQNVLRDTRKGPRAVELSV